MGLSGGSKSKSESGSAQPWAKPFATSAAGNVQDVFNQNQNSLEGITKGITGLIPGISDQYQSWSPVTGQAPDYYGDVLSGKFLDRQSVVYGKSVSVRLDLGCRRYLKKKRTPKQ